MAEHDLATLTWQRSSACADNSCVEFARAGSEVLVRDSNDRMGKILVIPWAEWGAFLLRLRNDEVTMPPPK